MKIMATEAEVAELWGAARTATERFGNDYGEGAYDMIQARSVRDAIERLRDEGD